MTPAVTLHVSLPNKPQAPSREERLHRVPGTQQPCAKCPGRRRPSTCLALRTVAVEHFTHHLNDPKVWVQFFYQATLRGRRGCPGPGLRQVSGLCDGNSREKLLEDREQGGGSHFTPPRAPALLPHRRAMRTDLTPPPVPKPAPTIRVRRWPRMKRLYLARVMATFSLCKLARNLGIERKVTSLYTVSWRSQCGRDTGSFQTVFRGLL